jgi:hypothetical protein
MHLHSYRDESHSRHFDLIGGGFEHLSGGLRLCPHSPLGPLGFFPVCICAGHLHDGRTQGEHRFREGQANES